MYYLRLILRKLKHPICYTYVFYEIANQAIAINILLFWCFYFEIQTPFQWGQGPQWLETKL